MSKYPFFDKKGRPSSYEQGICKKINKLLYDGSVSQADVNKYQKEHSGNLPSNTKELESFYNFVTGEKPNDIDSVQEDNFDNSEIDDFSDIQDVPEDINSDEFAENKVFDMNQRNPDAIDFDPFEAPVIEEGREYTKGIFNQPEPQIEEYSDGGDSDSFFDDEDFLRPEDDEEVEQDIPEPTWTNTVHNEPQEERIADDSEMYDVPDEDVSNKGEKLGGDNLQELSPQQKRKAAEKTAEAIMQMYGKFVPLPFIKIASFNDTKIQKMAYEGKIDLNMPLENNVTVRQFIDGTNEQVQSIFTVTDEQKEEIKEPLIDVLLEQELALTPTQRLLMAVGGHLVTMGFSAFQLMQNHKVSLEAFERYHQEMKGSNTPPPTNRPQQASQVKFTSNNQKENFSDFDKDAVKEMMKKMEEDDVIDPSNDPTVTVTEGY